MDLPSLIGRMARTPPALNALLRDLDDEVLTWRPEEGSWSLLEIACHLVDEERRDFRPRLERVLDDPARPWDPIDPEAWARDEQYNERDIAPTLDAFGVERARSLAWLRTLRGVDWSIAHPHPRGDLSAGHLLGAWAAHDALHLRQIAKRFYQLAQREAGKWGVGYAGSL